MKPQHKPNLYQNNYILNYDTPLIKNKYRKLFLEYKIRTFKKNIQNNSKKIILLSFIMFLLTISSFVFLNKYFNGITGFQIVGTRLIILRTIETYCNLSLERGWNLVSFPCVGEDTDLKLFFSIANFSNGSFQSLIYYDVNDEIDPWKSYNPDLPNWTMQDLDLISRRKGYWLYLENSSNVFINSSLVTPTLFTLHPGWNLIGFPSLNNSPVSEIFDQLIPNFDYVYMYNASNNEWKEYTWNLSKPSKQNLDYVIINYGYWIYILNKTELIIR